MAETSSSMSSADWPASRVLAAVGGAIGLIVALAVLAGVGANYPGVSTTPNVATGFAASLVAAAGVITLVLSILILVDAYLMNTNPRFHGGLCVLWGVLGLFFGLGVWLGAVLAIIGGIMAFVQTTPTVPERRRPVV